MSMWVKAVLTVSMVWRIGVVELGLGLGGGGAGGSRRQRALVAALEEARDLGAVAVGIVLGAVAGER